jgi:hypothetical protein
MVLSKIAKGDNIFHSGRGIPKKYNRLDGYKIIREAK